MQENKFKGGEKVRIKQGIFQNRSTKLHLGEIVTVIGIHFVLKVNYKKERK